MAGTTARLWAHRRPITFSDRDVLHLDLRGARGVEAIDPVVDDRAQQQQDLADDVRDLLLQLGRDELAQRAQERDERVELVARVAMGERGGVLARLAGQALGGGLRGVDALAQLGERVRRGHRR